MHNRVKILITESTNKDLLAVFMQVFEKLSEGEKAQAPAVVSR